MKTHIYTKTYIQMFIAALHIISPKQIDNVNVLKLTTGYTVVNPYDKLNKSLDVHNNMD